MLRVVTEFTGAPGSPYFSTMMFGGLDTVAADDAVALVGAFWNGVDSLIGSDANWSTQSDVEVVDEATGALLEVFPTTPQSGVGGGGAGVMSIASQALVRWRTGQIVGKRELRGRTFIPFVAATANSNGFLSSAAQTTIQTAASALVASATAPLWVWSRTHGVAHPVVSSSVWQQWAILRTRRD